MRTPRQLSGQLRTAASVTGDRPTLRSLLTEAADFIDRSAPIIEAMPPGLSAADEYIEKHGYEDKG